MEHQAYPHRAWNTADFVGKYHISKIDNKLAPLPGSQIHIENNFIDAKKKYAEHLQDVQKHHDDRLRTKLEVKEKSAALQTKVYFDTLFGNSLRGIEKVLNEKENLLESDDKNCFDEYSAISRFRKMIEAGNALYVSNAVSNGFQSINYQDPISGNTFLHLAVRHGHVDTVEELLKFKANPDIKNNLGNYPIHEAWLFWNTDRDHRTREQRLKQENQTCEILLKILSYGGYVDAKDVNQQTPLHVACRLGPTRAAKVLLTFYADLDHLNSRDESAMDFAEEFEQHETLRLLQAWKEIRPQFIHTDFHIIWHKFLRDYEAIISKAKSAETILAELELEEHARYMERASKKYSVLIDDPLLQHAFQVTQSAVATKIPKPWESGWRKYVKATRAAGVVDLKSRLESLKTKMQTAQQLSDKAALGKSSRQQHRQIANADGFLPTRSLPDRPAPLPYNQQQEQRKALEESNPHHSQLDQRRRQYAREVALDAKFLPFTTTLTQQSALGLSLRTAAAPRQGTEEAKSILRRIVSQGLEFDRLEQYKQQQGSSLEELLGLQRTPPKNVLGAYCEAAEVSKLNARDKLYDSLSNLKPLDLESGGRKTPSLSRTNTAESSDGLLHGKNSNKTQHKAPKLHFVKLDPEQKKQIDLVHAGTSLARPRYVQLDLLPAKFALTKVEHMIQAAKERDEAENLKKANLQSESGREEARRAMESNLQEQSTQALDEQAMAALMSGGAAPDDNARPGSTQRRRLAAGRQRAISQLFLSDQTVKYGEGRLQSSHRMKAPVEEPWSTVGGRYHTLDGDRTA